MPGTNQFLPFAVGAGANTLTPTAYAALTSLLSSGFAAGVANSAQFNTALRQATTAAAGLGQFIANQGGSANDDGSATNFAAALASALLSVAAASVSFASLSMSATGTNANASVSAAELLLRGSDGSARLLTNVNLTLNTAGTGANGLDSGALAASTWYSVWVIHNGTTAAALMSLSATTPTMPSGYTHKVRVGWIRTDGTANKFPLAFKQYGRMSDMAPAAGTNLTAYQLMASGSTSGSPSAVSASSFAPPTASAVYVAGGFSSGVANSTVFVGPTAASALNTSSLINQAQGANNTYAAASAARVPLLTTNIYYNSNTTVGFLVATGWEDNL